jgi:transcriptional regulator with XRE-family HTH domain
MFAERLKELRKEKGITQVELAKMLDVSNGTVGMWEVGKREPSFETINEMSRIFDKRIDYILGYSNDPSSPVLPDDEIDQLGIWQLEEDFTETTYAYLRLDDYGKEAVESIIRAEMKRCKDMGTLGSREDYQVSIKVVLKKDE